jgi:hypothetical protein
MFIQNHNVSTGEIVEQQLTTEQIKEIKAQEKEMEIERFQREKEAMAKVTARQAVLDKLGLSVDEVAALLG